MGRRIPDDTFSVEKAGGKGSGLTSYLLSIDEAVNEADRKQTKSLEREESELSEEQKRKRSVNDVYQEICETVSIQPAMGDQFKAKAIAEALVRESPNGDPEIAKKKFRFLKNTAKLSKSKVAVLDQLAAKYMVYTQRRR